ncbi:MAG: hypothetical protein ACHQF4_06420 [Sphingobacteriales bacterium]
MCGYRDVRVKYQDAGKPGKSQEARIRGQEKEANMVGMWYTSLLPGFVSQAI